MSERRIPTDAEYERYDRARETWDEVKRLLRITDDARVLPAVRRLVEDVEKARNV